MKKRSLVLIDQSAILHNVKIISNQAPGAQMYAVVKQDAYGHGAVDTAKLLSSHVHRFVVATVEEGIELRHAGITLPIIVLEPPQAVFTAAYRNFNLIAVVSDLDHLSFLDSNIPFHIEINTGMNRLGIDAAAISGFCAKMSEKNLKPEGIFTHFASSLEKNPTLTRDQYNRFRAIFHHFDGNVIKHAGNSEAVFQLGESHFDAIRPGVALFGEGVESGVRPAMSWLSQISQVHHLNAGEGISYGWTWKAASTTHVSTIPVGYADGYPRVASNKSIIEVDGKWFPQIGTVTMDYCFADTGTFKPVPGTPVWLIKPAYPMSALADVSGTISYELMCSIGSRNERLHVASLDNGFKLNVENEGGREPKTVLSRK